MKRQWTKQQAQAIGARDGSVLVSAAAGSGKTAVLVERVIERLTDKDRPSSADRLLIVTFTKAAASEMKERIAAALENEIAKAPSDEHLIKQQLLLPSAKICTIDSFCARVVREHFEQLEISPDFRTGDEGELQLLSQKAMTLTLEELYMQGEKGFTDLVELLFKGRDDSFLSETILEMYRQSVSYPFPEKWLGDICADYESAKPLRESRFGRVILGYARDAVAYCNDVLAAMRAQISGVLELEKAFSAAVESDCAGLRTISDRLEGGTWDEVRQAVEGFEFIRRGSVSKELKNDPEVQFLSDSRDRLKDVINKNLAPLFCSSEAEFEDDMRFFAPMTRSLCKAVGVYSKHFSELKSEKQLADFNDITHLALSLLVCETKDGFERTELAKELQSSFDEILIDEYQDTNKAQDMLFTAVSNNNLFRVGDVKQSIYRFRQAMPEIFIELKNKLPLYDGERNNYPSKIILKNNFRSRRSVTGCVNFVFSQVMSEMTGGVEYNDEEQLVFSAAYDEKKDECAEFHLLETAQLDTDEMSGTEYQADYTAALVEDIVKSGFTVKGEDGSSRPVRYSDIAILMRSMSSRGEAYAEALKRRGIPCFTQLDADFFSAPEISLMLNLLRVIDNPKQDVALLSVLMSPLFGFSPDECAAIRSANREGNIYSCLLSAAARGEKRSLDFLEKISYFRRIAVCMNIVDFIRTVYDETGIDAAVRCAKGASAKKENLMLLLDYADIYEKSGYYSLSGFVRFVDRLERAKGDLPGAVGVSADADVVRIMTVHKSKGLEFPVCILAGCGTLFNRSDEIQNAVISSESGLGLIRRDEATLARYPTVCHRAVKCSLRRDAVSEEMRVLYVAMTRAKEKLIMVSAVRSAEKAALKCVANINAARKKITPFASSMATSYSDWLLTAFLRHEDFRELRESAGISENIVLPSDFRMKLVIKRGYEGKIPDEEKRQRARVDQKLLKTLEERFSWRYKYEKLSYVVSKRAASEVDKNFVDREYFASSRPSFLSAGLTGAQKGIATHSFMQFADYERAKADLEGEINAVFERGLLTEREKEAVDRKQLKDFFESTLCERILKSTLVMREKKFTINVPISEVYPELSEFEDEKVMIQGIADCAFLENGELVVLDYKTDRLKTKEQFCEKYKNQVKTYKKALELCTGYKVREMLLYSFFLSQEIEIDAE